MEDLLSKFTYALEDGEIEVIKEMVKDTSFLNMVDKNGCNPLMITIQHDNNLEDEWENDIQMRYFMHDNFLETIRLLLEASVEQNICFEYGSYPLEDDTNIFIKIYNDHKELIKPIKRNIEYHIDFQKEDELIRLKNKISWLVDQEGYYAKELEIFFKNSHYCDRKNIIELINKLKEKILTLIDDGADPGVIYDYIDNDFYEQYNVIGDCIICLNPIYKKIYTTCGDERHSLHKLCYHKVLQKTHSCPICKTPHNRYQNITRLLERNSMRLFSYYKKEMELMNTIENIEIYLKRGHYFIELENFFRKDILIEYEKDGSKMINNILVQMKLLIEEGADVRVINSFYNKEYNKKYDEKYKYSYSCMICDETLHCEEIRKKIYSICGNIEHPLCRNCYKLYLKFFTECLYCKYERERNSEDESLEEVDE